MQTDERPTTRRHDARKAQLDAELLSLAETAAVCGVSYSTLWQMVHDGTFPVPPVKIGKQWKFPRRKALTFVGAEPEE